MAKPGETPIPDPTPPAPEHPNKSSSAKRPRDDGDFAFADAPSPKRRVKSAMGVLFRIVVPSKQIGKVIGKVGSRIQKIREETKATIKIADAIAPHEDRVIIINSKDSDNNISDAENALHQIANLILQDYDSNLEALKVGDGRVSSKTIRLLIAGTQAGSLIGTSGQNIYKLRNSSGANITVLGQNQLPLCASAHESDRVVQISGDVSAVMKALEEIGIQLRDNPPKQVISLSPTYNLSAIQPLQRRVDPTSADYATLEMMISETMIGGLIGRCGSNISRIRIESGATIRVYGGKGVQKQRQIHLGGSAQQVALAKQRIDEYIYSQMIQQTGVQQSVDPAAGMMTNAALAPFYTSATANQAALAPFFTSTTANQVPAYPGLPFYTPPM